MLSKLNVDNRRSDVPAGGNKKGIVFQFSSYKLAPYPNDFVAHGHVIRHEELPGHVWRGSELQVYVRKVNSPSEFWINLFGTEYSRKLVTLRANMRKFYEQEDDSCLLPSYAVLVDQFCVCIYRNEWHRAKIVNTAEKDHHLVDVFLIDRGGTVTVSTENLRFMHKTFSYLASQAFRADLPDIKPINSAEWPNCVCLFFRQETCGKKFRAKLVDVDRKRHSVSLKLFDVNGKIVSEKLLSNNMAEAETHNLDPTQSPVTRNKDSVDSSLDASSVELMNSAGIPEDLSPPPKDDSLAGDEKTDSRSVGAPVSCKSVELKDVAIAGKRLLLVRTEEKNYFILSDFLEAFAVLHEHVVLKLLETFPTLVVVEKMRYRELRLLLDKLRGREIRGVSHLVDHGIMPSVHLLPVNMASKLLTFLGEDDDQTTFVHNFVSSLV